VSLRGGDKSNEMFKKQEKNHLMSASPIEKNPRRDAGCLK
jgi:hypothetical protein